MFLCPPFDTDVLDNNLLVHAAVRLPNTASKVEVEELHELLRCLRVSVDSGTVEELEDRVTEVRSHDVSH